MHVTPQCAALARKLLLKDLHATVAKRAYSLEALPGRGIGDTPARKGQATESTDAGSKLSP